MLNYTKGLIPILQAGQNGKINYSYAGKYTYILVFLYTVCVCCPSSQQQSRQGIQVSHVRVVTEDPVDPLLLVREDIIQLPLQL